MSKSRQNSNVPNRLSVADRTELLTKTGTKEGEVILQRDIGLLYAWTDTQGIDNGGTVINVATGSWLADVYGELDVLWFGAVGDGVNDDAVALNSAITVASANASNTVVKNDLHALTLKTQVVFKSNVTIVNNGNINLASSTANFRGVSLTSFNFKGGMITVTDATQAGSIIALETCTDCNVRDMEINDAGTGKTGADSLVRITDSLRCGVKSIIGTDVVNYGFRWDTNTGCSIIDCDLYGTAIVSLIEVNGGTRNRYVNNRLTNTTNTTYSTLSFNDQYSICSNNITNGGAYGITAGHIAPNEANYSVVSNNQISNCATSGINIQYTQFATFTGNIIFTAPTGIIGGSGSAHCILNGNIIKEATLQGIRSGEHYILTGNMVYGSPTCYRPNAEPNVTILTGNMAMNAAGTAFSWGITGAAANATIVGNFAGDDQGVPTMVTGFKANEQSLMLGNSTDGTATFRQFDGNYSSIYAKDLSSATRQVTPSNSGVVGGTGSAGAGTQYVAIELGGTTYKILHDGTV